MNTTTTNSALYNDHRCKACLLKTYNRLFEKYQIEEKKKHEFLDFFEHVSATCRTQTSPEIQRELTNKFREMFSLGDLFVEEKQKSNAVAAGLYSVWKEKVSHSESPFETALRLSIAGNIMDYGANNDFDIHQTIAGVINAKIDTDFSEELKKKLERATTILYLGDNSGEIFFDKLFIETFKRDEQKIYFAVKSGPILNDVTRNDALLVRINDVAEIISNGFDAPTTLLDKVSPEFMDIFKRADVIISKGQGNLEGLFNLNDSRIFFLLTAKCEPIAELLGVEKQTYIVRRLK